MVVFKETAEEQLLRMIEGSAPAGKTPTVPTPSTVSPWQRIGEWFRRFPSPWRRWWISMAPRRAPTDPFLGRLQMASAFLWMALAGLGLYLVVDLVWIRPAFRPVPVSDASSESEIERAASSEKPRSPLKTLSEYMAAVVQRNPFITPGALVLPQQQAVQSIQTRLEELAKDLVVVGIDRGPSPVALVESTQESRTYILNAGDEVHGMRVKSITAEGVLLTYEGQEYLLR